MKGRWPPHCGIQPRPGQRCSRYRKADSTTEYWYACKSLLNFTLRCYVSPNVVFRGCLKRRALLIVSCISCSSSTSISRSHSFSRQKCLSSERLFAICHTSAPSVCLQPQGDPFWLGQHTFFSSLFVPHPSPPTRSQVHHIYLLMHSSQNRSKRKRGKNVSNDDDDTALAQMAVSRVEDAQTDAYGRSRPQAYQQHTDTYIPSSSRPPAYTFSRDGPSSHADSQDHFHPRTSDGRYRSGRDNYDVADSRDSDQRRPRFSHESDFQSGGRDRTSRDFVQGYSAHRNESQGWAAVDNHDDAPQWGSPSPDWRKEGWDTSRNREPRSQGNRRWQSDNGWESRKRDRHQNRRPPDSQDDGSFSKEDRSWEPGPGWHSRGEQTYRNQRGRSGPGKMKGKKNNQNRPRQRGDKDRDHDRRWDRDRRNDNDGLNKYVPSFCPFYAILNVSSAGKEGSFTLCLPSQSAVLSSNSLLLPDHVHGPPTLSILVNHLGVARGRGHSHRNQMLVILALYGLVVVLRREERIGQGLQLHLIEATSLEHLHVGEVFPLCPREAGVGAGAQVEVLRTGQGRNTDYHPQLLSEIFPFLYPRPPSDNEPILFSIKKPSRR